MKACKFGGSVLKNADDIRNIAGILNIDGQQKIIVVSAFYGVTNKLVELFNLAKNGENFTSQLDEIKNFHIKMATDLGVENDDILALLSQLEQALSRISISNEDEIHDLVLSFGERLSSLIIYKFLSSQDGKTGYIHSEEVVKTDSNFGRAKVFIEETKAAIQAAANALSDAKIIVCAGFIASSKEGKITTLGRNGSDYSAALYSSAVNASVLEIWKDTNGLFTADPKIVENVRFIDKISYQEMRELSSLGNKVVHVDAITPCITANIPILLKNCYNTSFPGTLIASDGNSDAINGIVKLDGLSTLTLQINEMVDIDKFAIKLQETIGQFRDYIVSFSQNINQRIFAAVIKNKADDFIKKITEIFGHHIDIGDIKITQSEPRSMITVLGSNLINSVGVSGQIFGILQKEHINVYSIQDEFSATRISFLCPTESANLVIKLLHKELVEK